MIERGLPPAPPLFAPEVAAPTPQAKPRDELGSPLEMLSTCRWCNGLHASACPFIKQVEWHPSGQVARVLLEERADLKRAILYLGEETDDSLRPVLVAITLAKTLGAAREIASALLKVLDEEKPG